MNTKKDMTRAVTKIQTLFSHKDFKGEYAYCAIFVLSHGGDSEWISCGINDHFSIKSDILAQLTHNTCPYLKGRPLIGVVRVCRGKNHNIMGKDPESQLATASGTPLMPDVYILHSMPDGFYDSSSASQGSVFIREFCEGVQKQDDIERIVKAINEKEILRLVPDQNGTQYPNVLQTSAGPVQLKKPFRFF